MSSQKNAFEAHFLDYDRLVIHGKELWVPRPDTIPPQGLVERTDIIDKALAAWTRIDESPPLHLCFIGPPGMGKNAVVYSLANILGRDLYILNGHEEFDAEDMACTPTMTSNNTIVYTASGLFAAMLRGGICFIDELDKIPTSALAPLAQVLDDRRTLTSVQAGLHLKAHRDFLFCAAMNSAEAGGIGLPDFIDERLRPAIYVGHPGRKVLEQILRTRTPEAPQMWLRVFLEDYEHEDLSPREAVKLLAYAYRLSRRDHRPLNEAVVREYLSRALPEAARHTGSAPEFELPAENPDTQEDEPNVELDPRLLSEGDGHVH